MTLIVRLIEYRNYIKKTASIDNIIELKPINKLLN